MAMKQFNISVSMLRQYCFCPRIPYFYLVRQLNINEQPWIKIGVDEHNRQAQLLQRRNLSRFGIGTDQKWVIKSNVELYSEIYSLHGICDAVVSTSKGSFILEFKNYENVKLNLGAKIQLAAYSMLYEEKYKVDIKYGFILFGTKAKTIELQINNDLRKKVIQTRDNIISIIEKGTLPSSAATEKQCSQCEFFNFCADRY